MTTNAPRTQVLPPDGATPRQIAAIVNQLVNGKFNSVGTVTLTPNAASTTVSDPRVAANSVVLMFPQTSNAAAALASTYISPANYVAKASFVITHANNAQTDKTFGYVILG